MFKITQQKGFHMTFANGNCISVQFGPGNYVDESVRYGEWEDTKTICEKGSSVAEIAVWDNVRDWFRLSEWDTVRGWVTPDDVVGVMFLVKNFTDERLQDELCQYFGFTISEGENDEDE
ncbi:MAG: hypothetical protein VW443_04795 [Pseudomonadales bacterium]|jgi:hypothetical protein